MAESEPDIGTTADTPLLALTAEQWGVYCKELEKI